MAALFALACLVGCGGGGKHVVIRILGDGCPLGTNPGQVHYSTTWGSGTPALASQALQIVDSDGGVLLTFAINRQGLAASTLDIPNITPGVYEFRASLYSQENAGGVLMGVSSQVIDLCGTTRNVRTTASLPPTKLKVSPGSVGMIEQQSRRFVATALAANGDAVFVPPGGLQWSVLGGIGSVDPAGEFNATTAGDGSVRAAVASPSLSAAGAVHVDAFIVTHTKWTVFVYLNAANDLYWASDLNVNQMERVADNPEVRFVIQWKQSRDAFPASSFDGVRRVLVKPDNSSAVVSEVVQSNLVDGLGNPLDMGIPQTLKDFLDWGTTFYPADRYALVIWNHGNGWHRRPIHDTGRAFSYDDQSGNAIQIWQMNQGLAGHHFSIIAWDASLMQMVEVAYEARSFADFIVGSEESPPGAGYPYDLVFDDFRDNPDATTSSLTNAFVDAMVTYPPYFGSKITQSSIDTTQLSALKDSLSTLGAALKTAYQADPVGMTPIVQQVRADAQSYSPNATRIYRDIVDLCLQLEANAATPAAVSPAAADVRTKVAAAVLFEGHNGLSPNSHGVSIDFSDFSTFGPVSGDYLQMQFAIDSLWDEWLSVAP